MDCKKAESGSSAQGSFAGAKHAAEKGPIPEKGTKSRHQGLKPTLIYLTFRRE